MRLISADQLRAGMLRIATGKAIILVERVVLLESGEPVVYARTYYQAERYRFEHKLVRPIPTDEKSSAVNERRYHVGDVQSAPGFIAEMHESEAAQ